MDEESLDLRGLKCPLPALMTRKRLAQLADGSVLSALTTDPMAVVDIPHMCAEDGHAVLEVGQADDHHVFRIRKGGA
jgi:tRNA 2-thiouridine synthesizing protein A